MKTGQRIANFVEQTTKGELQALVQILARRQKAAGSWKFQQHETTSETVLLSEITCGCFTFGTDVRYA